MIAKELISDNLSALRTSDTGEQALTMMSIFLVKHLPIVNNEQLLGLISEEEILEHDINEPIGSYKLSMSRPFCYQREHLFEVMSKMAEFNLTVIPVVDDLENYLGLITQEDLIQFYARSFSFTEPGSIMVVETSKINYSLAEISQIIEGENASILSSFLTLDTDSTTVLVTIKINRQELSQIIASLNRYDYQIKATFTEEEYIDGLQERYDALINYLNV